MKHVRVILVPEAADSYYNFMKTASDSKHETILAAVSKSL
jgi:hypothetical protein